MFISKIKIPKKPGLFEDAQRKNISVKYPAANLDHDQKKFFDAALSKKNLCLLVQSGPGSGKTFTLLTLSNHSNIPVTVVIFKNDSLVPFKPFSNTLSNTSFFMSLFSCNYMEYKNMMLNISSKMNPIETTFAVIEFLRIAKVENYMSRLMIFDEYTVLPKTLLFVLLLLFRHYETKTIFSGDRHQLQTIENKKSEISSFDMVQIFADNTFEFKTNHRCKNIEYNKFIQHLSKFSSETSIDFYVESLITAMFYKQIIYSKYDPNQLKNIIMAAHHSVIANELSDLISKYNCPVSYYWIKMRKELTEQTMKLMEPCLLNNNYYLTPEGLKYTKKSQFCNLLQNQNALLNLQNQSNVNHEELNKKIIAGHEEILKLRKEIFGRNLLEGEMIKPLFISGKFLPFIPLVEGNKYFFQEFSESKVVTLKEIVFKEGTKEIDYLIIENDSNLVMLNHTNCDKVTYSEHKNFLLQMPNKTINRDGDLENVKNYERVGNLINFNIYPANIMSLYMSQGRTISDKIILVLTETTTTQAIYVGCSRVNDPSQFSKIIIPHQFEMLLSFILNFPEMKDPNYVLSVDTIINRLQVNYKIYGVNEINAHSVSFDIISYFSQDQISRDIIYNRLANLVVLKKIIEEPKLEKNTETTIYHQMFEQKEILLALSFLQPLEARVWLKEYSKFDLKFHPLLEVNSRFASNTLSNFLNFNYLEILNENTAKYILRKSKVKNRDPEIEHLFIENVEFSKHDAIYANSEFLKIIYFACKNNTVSKEMLEEMLINELNNVNYISSKQPNKDPPEKKYILGKNKNVS